MSDIEGGCACGAVRFKLSGALPGSGVCHCRDCQKSTGGGPNYVALVPRTGFEVTKGQPKVYVSTADSGAEVGRAFCAECGSPLWSIPRADMPFFTVKLGALDDPSGYAELLADEGLTAQARAPMTPIVKLVFGATYDKTRLTEYAAALGFARHSGVARGELAAFLETYEGGLKAVVKAERARRAPAAKPDRAEAARTAAQIPDHVRRPGAAQQGHALGERAAWRRHDLAFA